MRKAYLPARYFSGTEFHEGQAILTEAGIITDIVPAHAVPDGFERIDMAGDTLVPAFIDLQIYGGNGLLFSQYLNTESLKATVAYSRAGGASHICITIATNSQEVVRRGIVAVHQYWKEGGEGLLGLHLEGPFINKEKRGAHLDAFIHPPALQEVTELLEEAKGAVRIMTLAPECCDPEVVHFLQAHGVVVSAGHSNATYVQAIKGFDSGIRLATHLFNAMSPLQSREPGMVGAIYDHPAVMSSMVVDGVHTDFAAVRISKKILGDRLFLITDAVTETSEGPYPHVFHGDRYCMPNGTLSGSSLTMWKAVRNCVEQGGIALEEALRMASAYPARALGMDNRLGYIRKGYEAHFTTLSWNG